MDLIRRVNLDMFWEKEASTVEGVLRVFQKACGEANHLGLSPEFMRDGGIWPIGDKVGFGEAMLILWESLQRNKTSGELMQFDTIRKLRSMSANVQLRGVFKGMEGVGFKDGSGMSTLTQCTTNSVLFSKFIKGCEKRMGRNVKQDLALSVDILLQILSQLEEELSRERSTKRGRDIVLLGSALVIGFCDALRGNEIFLVEAASLCHYFKEGVTSSREHVVIPLMGRFKGETGERNVLRALVSRTASGIKINWWISQLVRLLIKEKRDSSSAPGPAFCDEEGMVLSYSYLNGLFHAELAKVQDTHSNLIPAEVEVAEAYNLYRSLRRGATTRATQLNYSETVINVNNRWRSTQSNKGVGGLKKMSQLYVEMGLAKDALLKFSASL